MRDVSHAEEMAQRDDDAQAKIERLEAERDNLRIDLRLARTRVENLEAQVCLLREALSDVRGFVDDELETRKTSMLPDPDANEAGYIEEAESARNAIDGALYLDELHGVCSHAAEVERLQVEMIRLSKDWAEYKSIAEEAQMDSKELLSQLVAARRLCGEAILYVAGKRFRWEMGSTILADDLARDLKDEAAKGGK